MSFLSGPLAEGLNLLGSFLATITLVDDVTEIWRIRGSIAFLGISHSVHYSLNLFDQFSQNHDHYCLGKNYLKGTEFIVVSFVLISNIEIKFAVVILSDLIS